MNKPLETESMVKLRALAQSLGTPYTWQDDKKVLLAKIRSGAEKRTKPEERPMQINILLQAGNNLTQEQIKEALEDFLPLGLIITFPGMNTWELYCNKKRDSGSMTMGLWNIVQCAKEIVKP
jgi:hypothetical protein